MNHNKIIKEELEIIRLLKEFNNTINEGFSNSDFGSNAKIYDTSVTIPKENENIKSPTSGTIANLSPRVGCRNQTSVQFEMNSDTYYLEYCGISTPKVSKGQSVSKGTVLGATTDNVTVNLLDSRGNRFYFDNIGKTTRTSPKTKVSKTPSGVRIDDRYHPTVPAELGQVRIDNRYKRWDTSAELGQVRTDNRYGRWDT